MDPVLPVLPVTHNGDKIPTQFLPPVPCIHYRVGGDGAILLARLPPGPRSTRFIDRAPVESAPRFPVLLQWLSSILASVLAQQDPGLSQGWS